MSKLHFVDTLFFYILLREFHDGLIRTIAQLMNDQIMTAGPRDVTDQNNPGESRELERLRGSHGFIPSPQSGNPSLLIISLHHNNHMNLMPMSKPKACLVYINQSA